MTRLHHFIIALSIVAVNPNSSQAAKPPSPPPDPPPPASCPGTFPAYAYTRDVTKKQGSKVILLSTELYLANSTGTCSIKIANPVSQNGLSQIGLINYRQNDTSGRGRIVFESNTGLGMVNFSVVAGTVTTTLPLTISNVYGSLAWHTYTLSKNAQTIYVVDEVRDSNGNWIDTIRTVDISSCSSNCPAQVLYTFPLGNNAYHLSLNDAEDRLYMSFHDFGLDRGAISFMQKTAGVWSTTSRRDVVSNLDGGYLSGWGKFANGKWDFDRDLSQDDVLAVEVDGVIQVLDVTNCLAVGVQSCISFGESTVVASGIAGELIGFRSSNLIVASGVDVNEVNLDTLDTIATAPLQAKTVDSAD